MLNRKDKYAGSLAGEILRRNLAASPRHLSEQYFCPGLRILVDVEMYEWHITHFGKPIVKSIPGNSSRLFNI